MDGGGAQAGTSERPGRCQPSPLRKKDLSMFTSKYMSIYEVPGSTNPGKERDVHDEPLKSNQQWSVRPRTGTAAV